MTYRISFVQKICEQIMKPTTIETRKALWIAVVFCVAILGLTVVGNPWLARFEVFSQKANPFDYIWRLVEPTAFTRTVVWVSYAAHQLASWGLIWYAQRNKAKYASTLHPFNVAALAMNGAFMLWHWVQTQWTYDALAQDVSIFSSQGSVILMLVMILAMETRRRGLFFGKRVSFRQEFVAFLRKYHGYVFSWALVYTFWYHPMVSTPGHLVGFMYMSFLLIQSSIFYTRLHVNRWWTFALEFLVLPHGVMVALANGNGMWPMFLLGFFALVVVTQMFGLPISNRARWAIAGLFVLMNIGVYGLFQRPLSALPRDLLAIPAIEYISVFVLYGLFMLGLGGTSLWRRLFARRGVATDAAAVGD